MRRNYAPFKHSRGALGTRVWLRRATAGPERPTLWLILAGMPANSGELAKVVRLSTASTRGRVASPHLCRFTSFGSWSSTCNKRPGTLRLKQCLGTLQSFLARVGLTA